MEICSLLLPFAILEVIGYAILWPVLQKKARLRIPRQFSIADFAALLCYVQLVMALTFYYRRLFENSIGLGVAMSIMGAATVALWGAAVSTLNQLEMNGVVRRMLFLLILLPGVIAVMAGLPLGLVLAAQFNLFDNSPTGLTWLFGGSIAIILFGISLRLLAAWLVKDAKVVPPPPPEPIVGGYYLPANLNLRPIIIVVDYDPAWPQVFESLRSRIGEAVGSLAIAIEHVGSTAVPGLAAKPIIDIGIVVPSEIEIPLAIARLATLGYVHRGDLGIAGREAFRSPDDLPPHHLYLYIQGNSALANHLAIRDYLRHDPAAADAYGKLKKDLARRFPGNIDSYVAGKTDFLLAILRDAGFPAEDLAAIEAANRKK